MPEQTEESKRADIEAFLDTYEEFIDIVKKRRDRDPGYNYSEERISLFGIYISRM